MKKNAQLTLERERLKLKIKQQEYEIKKSMLDLKDKYHPFNVALNVAGDYLMGRDTNGVETPSEALTSSSRRQIDGGLGLIIAQIMGFIQNYFQFADSLANKPQATPTLPKNEQYVIGEDDK